MMKGWVGIELCMLVIILRGEAVKYAVTICVSALNCLSQKKLVDELEGMKAAVAGGTLGVDMSGDLSAPLADLWPDSEGQEKGAHGSR